MNILRTRAFVPRRSKLVVGFPPSPLSFLPTSQKNVSRYMSTDIPQSFDAVEKAQVFASFFEKGQPLWEQIEKLAGSSLEATPTHILDLGCGPGEPACHFANKYRSVPVLASDIAKPMVDLAEKRAKAKGLTNVKCMVLDMCDLSALDDNSYDLVISDHAYQFVPDKPKALAETYRVMKPGTFDLIRC